MRGITGHTGIVEHAGHYIQRLRGIIEIAGYYRERLYLKVVQIRVYLPSTGALKGHRLGYRLG